MNNNRNRKIKAAIIAEGFLRGQEAGLEEAIRIKLNGNEMTYETINIELIEYLVDRKVLTYDDVDRMISMAKKDKHFLKNDVVEYLKRLRQTKMLVDKVTLV